MLKRPRNIVMTTAAAIIVPSAVVAQPNSGSDEETTPTTVKQVVLVHGAFVDGSGWRGVYDDLTARGYRVSIVQNPLTSLEDDVAATVRILEKQTGPAILVGYSWGGTVITQAGVHPKVVGLVYVSALAPDAGETTAQQYEGYPASSEFVIETSPDGFGFVHRDKFHTGFAADLDKGHVVFLRDSQLPIRMSVFETKLTNAAWRHKPSWTAIPDEDRAFGEGMLLGMAKRIGATIAEIPGSHAAFISQSAAIADLIDSATRSFTRPANRNN